MATYRDVLPRKIYAGYSGGAVCGTFPGDFFSMLDYGIIPVYEERSVIAKNKDGANMEFARPFGAVSRTWNIITQR